MPLPWIIGGAAVLGVATAVAAVLSEDDLSSSSSNSSSNDENEKKEQELRRQAEEERLATQKRERKEEIKHELLRHLNSQQASLSNNLSKFANFSASINNKDIDAILNQEIHWMGADSLSRVYAKKWGFLKVSKLGKSLAAFSALYRTEIEQTTELKNKHQAIKAIENEIKKIDDSIADLEELIS